MPEIKKGYIWNIVRNKWWKPKLKNLFAFHTTGLFCTLWKHKKARGFPIFLGSIDKNQSLPEKCPYSEFFLIRIFLHSVQARENTERRTPNTDTFHADNWFMLCIGICLKGFLQINVLKHFIKNYMMEL